MAQSGPLYVLRDPETKCLVDICYLKYYIIETLQRRVAGALPVAVDVPRAGTSFKFVRPLVLNGETKVTFSYKNK